MLYNKAVTSIEVYVEKKNSLEAVDQVIQQAADDMRITGCPDVARDTLTPFTVQLVPTGLYTSSGNLYEPRHVISNNVVF